MLTDLIRVRNIELDDTQVAAPDRSEAEQSSHNSQLDLLRLAHGSNVRLPYYSGLLHCSDEEQHNSYLDKYFRALR